MLLLELARIFKIQASSCRHAVRQEAVDKYFRIETNPYTRKWRHQHQDSDERNTAPVSCRRPALLIYMPGRMSKPSRTGEIAHHVGRRPRKMLSNYFAHWGFTLYCGLGEFGQAAVWTENGVSIEAHGEKGVLEAVIRNIPLRANLARWRGTRITHMLANQSADHKRRCWIGQRRKGVSPMFRK